MHNFCTLFDSNYLSRGLALYRSLERTGTAFHLYIFAFDDRCAAILRSLSLSHATVIPLRDFEDAELLRVKPTRSRAEYCWTSTSSTILFVLEHYPVEQCTYLDADMLFFAAPDILFTEMGDRSILITEHRYSPQYNKEALSGKYCVQFVSFRKNEQGLTALRWWRDRCLEWCYARFEDGKFGDQKYLDDWMTRFRGVHELQHPGGGMAAWNVQQYDVFEKDGILMGRETASGGEFPVVFYHFHYLRFLSGGRIELGRRVLSKAVLRLLYVPYLKALQHAAEEVRAVDAAVDPHGTAADGWNWKSPLLYVYRKLTGIYHIYPLASFEP
ncbi:MAG: glycosyl transferase [Bacteroidetes bacterium]|nr:glycosyl transferase [Bacteroidota bacterium]